MLCVRFSSLTHNDDYSKVKFEPHTIFCNSAHIDIGFGKLSLFFDNGTFSRYDFCEIKDVQIDERVFIDND